MMDCMRARHKTPLKIFPDNFISSSGGRVLAAPGGQVLLVLVIIYNLETKSSHPSRLLVLELESSLTMKYVNVFVSTLNTSSE